MHFTGKATHFIRRRNASQRRKKHLEEELLKGAKGWNRTTGVTQEFASDQTKRTIILEEHQFQRFEKIKGPLRERSNMWHRLT